MRKLKGWFIVLLISLSLFVYAKIAKLFQPAKFYTTNYFINFVKNNLKL